MLMKAPQQGGSIIKTIIKDSNTKQVQRVNLGLKIQQQPDNFTCGLCACSSIYRFYGLDLRKARLRARLGVDTGTPYKTPDWIARRVNECWPDLKGTWPFDIVAVLHGDGFDFSWKTGPFDADLKFLRLHLQKGHPALALFGGKLDHWIAIGGFEEGGIRVADSGGDYAFKTARCRGMDKSLIPYEKFASHAMGILLVEREKDAEPREMGNLDFAKLYGEAGLFSGGLVISALAKQLKKVVR